MILAVKQKIVPWTWRRSLSIGCCLVTLVLVKFFGNYVRLPLTFYLCERWFSILRHIRISGNHVVSIAPEPQFRQCAICCDSSLLGWVRNRCCLIGYDFHWRRGRCHEATVREHTGTGKVRATSRTWYPGTDTTSRRKVFRNSELSVSGSYFI